MIDHGATLIFHHDWSDHYLERSRKPFKQIKSHVLLRWATEISESDEELTPRVTADAIEKIVAAIPESWLDDESRRAGYRDYLLHRVESPRAWVEDAVRAQALSV
jgi:hypothetical protein